MATLIVLRPASLRELSVSLDAPAGDLERLVRRNRIAPLTRIRGTAFYGEREIHRIYELVRAESDSSLCVQI